MKSLLHYSALLFLFLCINDLNAQVSPAYKDTTFTEYFRRTSGWTASDGSISVPLPSGKTIWLMGDSYIDNFNAADTTIPCLFQVRNSMLVQDIQNPSDLLTILDNTETGVNRTPVKVVNNDTTYFWPGHGYAKGDTAIIFWQQYSGANYAHRANYVSKIYTPGFTDASSIVDLAPIPLPEEVEFGTAVVVDSSAQYIYLYGFKKDWIIFRPLLARFPLHQDVAGPWEFFNGTGWSDDVNTAQQLMASTNDYVSPSFSVLKLQNKFYMISQDIGFLTCGLGRSIYSWESDLPQGPFTNKKLLYTIEDKYRGEYMITYNATAHPEFIKNNELLISYNVNGACTKYCEDPFSNRYNADLYRPKFIRVPLDYIDPALDIPDPVFPTDPPVTGIHDAAWDPRGIKVYPNPGKNGFFTVDVSKEKYGNEYRTKVYDLYGKLLLQNHKPGHQNAIELRNRGMYFLIIESFEKRGYTKIIVE